MLKTLNARVALLIAAILLWPNPAPAVTTPVQIATTGMPGVGTEAPNVLSVALPIQNIGSATAENVNITAVSLVAAPFVGPAVFPVALGNLAPGASVPVNAQFDRSALTPGSNYRMTVAGTYQTGGVTHGFAVNRNITMPLPSPGQSTLTPVVVTSQFVTDPPNLPVPSTLPEDEAEGRNPPGPPVPQGRPQLLFPGAFQTNLSGDQSPPGLGGGAPTISFGQDTSFGRSGGTPVDPSGASGSSANAANVVLTTGNTYASVSVDGGQTFTNINPFCMFGYIACDSAGNPTGSPLVDGNLCCDQIVQYVPSISRFIWLMQTWPSGWVNGVRTDAFNNPIPSRNNRLRVVVVSPDDVRSWATGGSSSWLVFDLTTGTFGLNGANDWMDYPDLAVGNTFLYVSVDKMVKNGGLIVARIPLNQLTAAGTINIGYTGANDIDGKAHGSHLTQNSGDSMFWAGHNTTNKLTVFNMPESSNVFSWRDVNINSYSNSDYSSSTPTGTNWLMGSNGFGLENLLGAVRVPFIGLCDPTLGCPPDEVWFAWGAGKDSGRNRPQPYVEVVHLDSQSFSVKQQMHIWNQSYAFAYPAFSRNSNGEVGVALGVGGGDREAHTSVGFMGDFQVWAMSNSDSSITRYGDYVTIRKASPNEKLFSAVGYGIRTGIGFDPHYVLFGRFCDVNPNDPSCQIIIK